MKQEDQMRINFIFKYKFATLKLMKHTIENLLQLNTDQWQFHVLKKFYLKINEFMYV